MFILLQGIADGWKYSNAPIQGIKWAQNETTVTHGILLWKRPFLIKTDANKKVIVIIWTPNKGLYGLYGQEIFNMPFHKLSKGYFVQVFCWRLTRSLLTW